MISSCAWKSRNFRAKAVPAGVQVVPESAADSQFELPLSAAAAHAGSPAPPEKRGDAAMPPTREPQMPSLLPRLPDSHGTNDRRIDNVTR